MGGPGTPRFSNLMPLRKQFSHLTPRLNPLSKAESLREALEEQMRLDAAKFLRETKAQQEAMALKEAKAIAYNEAAGSDETEPEPEDGSHKYAGEESDFMCV